MRDRNAPDRRPTGEPDRQEQQRGEQPPGRGTPDQQQQGGSPQHSPGTGQPPQRGGHQGPQRHEQRSQGGDFTPPGSQSHHTPAGGSHQGGRHQGGSHQGGRHQGGTHQGGTHQGPPSQQRHGGGQQSSQHRQQSSQHQQQSGGFGGRGGQQAGAGQGTRTAGQPGTGRQASQVSQGTSHQASQQAGASTQPPMGQQGAQAPSGGMQQSPGRTIPIQPAGVDRVAREEVVTADRDTPVATIVAMMEEQDVGTVVITDDDRPEGIITDRQIALALEETPDLTQRSVEDLMTEDPVTVSEDDDLFDAVRTLGEHDVRRVPVVDDEGTLVGVLSLDDVLVVLSGEFSSAADVIREQSPRF